MDTFTITYHITVRGIESVDRKVEEICLEQSAELPREVLSEEQQGDIPGTPMHKYQIGEDRYQVTIRWPLAHVGLEIAQFLNLLYGNISLKPGIQIVDLQWENMPERLMPGPSHGIRTLRRTYEIPGDPLSCSAIKPLGLAAAELGELVYQMGCGGIDIIKDDHNLANQEYAPFEDRVVQCVQAVREATQDTGYHPRYFPNITADVTRVMERYQKAAELGADGVLLSPHLTGLSTLASLAQSDFDLPIIAHPAFSGSLTADSTRGMSPSFLYGQLWRALGADFVIFPDAEGRFSFSREECDAIYQSAIDSSLPYPAAFPMAGGGLKLDNISGWLKTYGTDTVFLIGSSLYQHPKGLRYASKQFSESVRGNI